MDVTRIRTICLSFPAVEEDIKWDNDLCMTIGKKMFCITRLDGQFAVSLKVTDEEFDELTSLPGIVPAPYLARYKWIMVEDASCFDRKEWNEYLRRSYELVKGKLPKKIIRQLGLND